MTGVIILAAGASTRLGEPKQRLKFEGSSLLQRAVVAAGDSCCGTSLVVLGAHADAILADTRLEGINVVINPDWKAGMASSIRTGLEELLRLSPQTTGVILMLSDQPFADAPLLNRMIKEKKKTGKGIVACTYKDTTGVPVLFDKGFFPDLLSLKGQEGAKKLLFRNPEALATIPFPLGAIDIDTRADYKSLLQEYTNNK